MRRDSSIVVWLSDQKTDVVVDAPGLPSPGGTIQLTFIWAREGVIRKYVAYPEIAHRAGFGEMASTPGEGELNES